VLVVSQRDLRLQDGRTLRVYDSGGADAAHEFTVVWHHGSPQTGALLAPLLSAAARRGIRLVSYGRPSYGGSSPHPGRDVASAAADVAQLADALGVPRFAVMGASGGGPHALACAALLADRVTGAVCLAGLAPFTEDFDWYAGMVSDGGLRAAAAGREARARYAASDEFDKDSFTPADWAALSGAWASLGADAGHADAAGPDGLIDDDVAFVAPWGFDVMQIDAPVLLVQGGQDRIVPPAHAHWLTRHCRRAELWFRPHDGHISILNACPLAMDWLAERAAEAALSQRDADAR
jgi:pimeloyl-ACP methyl ester carboxylesterase